MNVFCERLKQLRKAAGLNQSELGEKLNCQRTRIADLERGKSTPSIEDLKALSETFKVSSDYLIGISDNQTNNEDINMIYKYTGLNAQTVDFLSNISSSDVMKLFETAIYGGATRSFFLDDAHLKEILNNLLTQNNFWKCIGHTFLYLGLLSRAIEKKHDAINAIEMQIVNNKKELFRTPQFQNAETGAYWYDDARLHYFEAIEAFKDCITFMTGDKLDTYNDLTITLAKKTINFQSGDDECPQ